MTSIFIIAECGSNWRFGNEPENAYRMIRAAKEAGADAAKFQFTSDGYAMAKRRGLDEKAGEMYERYVKFDPAWLPLLKAECDRVGISFGVTVYLPQDVKVIAPYTSFYKVSAFEAEDAELQKEIEYYKSGGYDFQVYVSAYLKFGKWKDATFLHCISKYPTELYDLGLRTFKYDRRIPFTAGLSDHTAHVLTGAVAVGAGARIIESHVRLHDTPEACPDFPHSLCVTEQVNDYGLNYATYVRNIRTAERML